MKSIRIILPALLLVALTGCTTTSYVGAHGEKFTRTSVLTKASIGKVELKDGDKTLSIEGYSNEQTEIAAAVAGSVAKALAPVK